MALAGIFSLTPCAASETLRTVVLLNDLPPGGPSHSWFFSLAVPALNNAGATAFMTALVHFGQQGPIIRDNTEILGSSIWSEVVGALLS
jgi:hypothetical protein